MKIEFRPKTEVFVDADIKADESYSTTIEAERCDPENDEVQVRISFSEIASAYLSPDEALLLGTMLCHMAKGMAIDLNVLGNQ